MHLSTNARDILPRGPLPLLPGRASVACALDRMRRDGVSALLVGDAFLKGIFTGRDFVVRVAARGLDPRDCFLGSVMTTHPECVAPEDPVAYVIERMAAGGYRHVPVVDGDLPVGIVSVRDLCAHTARAFRTGHGTSWIADELLDATVTEIATTRCAILSADAPLAAVLATMCEPGCTGILLTLEDELVGVITERDVVTRVDYTDPRVTEQPAAQFMTCGPLVATGDLSLAAALGLMTTGSFRHLPVVDTTGQPAALLSIADIISHLAGRAADQFLNLPPMPHLEAHAPWGG